MPKQGYDCSEEQLDYRNRVAGRGVDDGDAQRSRRVEGDVVDSDAGPPDYLELASFLQQIRGNPRRAATHDRVIVGDAGEQFVFG